MTDDTRKEADDLGRAWDAVVSGQDTGHCSDDSLLDIQFVHKHLTVPPMPSALRDAIWHEIATTRTLVANPSVLSPNGSTPKATLPITTTTSRPSTRSFRIASGLAIWRLIVIGACAGFVAGFLTGLWTRLAMRISGSLTIDRNRHLITDAGERVGVVTLEGTLFLAFFAAMIGIGGGMLYLIVRRWLPTPPLLRALSYGGVLFAVFGFVVMDGDNPDYHLFGPVWLNLLTFSQTYLLFGVASSLIVEALDTRLAPILPGRRLSWREWLPIAVLSPFGVIAMLVATPAALATGPWGVAIVALALGATVLVVMAKGLSMRSLTQATRIQRLGAAAMALPALLGVGLTIHGLFGIVTG